MNWKTSLDKYLTTPPDDGFDGWCEDVIDRFTDNFYANNEDGIVSYYGWCSDWMNKLFKKGVSTESAARIIERAHRLYINHA